MAFSARSLTSLISATLLVFFAMQTVSADTVISQQLSAAASLNANTLVGNALGSTYLLVTRYNEMDNWHKLNPYSTASKLLSADKDTSLEALKAVASNDERVSALRAAYPNEILLDADVKNGNTLNSYVSLEIEAKQSE